MSDNKHLTRPGHRWGEHPSAARLAVLAVHGRQQSPEFMRDVSQAISAPGLCYYAPHAFGDSWYPRPFTLPIQDNEPDLTQAVAALNAGLADIEADGFDRRHIVLWGFSQGACLLSQLVVHDPRTLGGLIIFTGGFLGTRRIEPMPGRPLDAVPALIRSIQHDPWVPAERVRGTAAVLTALGASVDLHIAPGDEHVITREATDAAGELLTEIAGRSDPGL